MKRKLNDKTSSRGSDWVAILIVAVFLIFPSAACSDDSSAKQKESPAATPEQHQAVDTTLLAETKSKDRLIVGWTERVKILPEELYFDAKLTPGLEGNMIHAENTRSFKRGKETWISFELTDKKGKTVKLERPLADETRFRTNKGKLEKRFKVELGYCLANHYMEMEFSLSDRSAFEHEVRLGRDALSGHFLIDPGRTRTSNPKCKPQSAKDK